ncbi:hypothetical protein Acr_00g0080200 [Actinidia rufa]|uniref:Uncharacterized protein n=1 Tax=Actinidia rufa TaxID=165716 RepID=A0A7J0DU05_9ERIC|nr:hypothetical protein Acr_00g0080200 [Actinidia rufa]
MAQIRHPLTICQDTKYNHGSGMPTIMLQHWRTFAQQFSSHGMSMANISSATGQPWYVDGTHFSAMGQPWHTICPDMGQHWHVVGTKLPSKARGSHGPALACQWNSFAQPWGSIGNWLARICPAMGQHCNGKLMAHNYLAMGSQGKSLGSFRHKHRHCGLALLPTCAVIG